MIYRYNERMPWIFPLFLYRSLDVTINFKWISLHSPQLKSHILAGKKPQDDEREFILLLLEHIEKLRQGTFR